MSLEPLIRIDFGFEMANTLLKSLVVGFLFVCFHPNLYQRGCLFFRLIMRRSTTPFNQSKIYDFFYKLLLIASFSQNARGCGGGFFKNHQIV